jgi:hypothetical protein
MNRKLYNMNLHRTQSLSHNIIYKKEIESTKIAMIISKHKIVIILNGHKNIEVTKKKKKKKTRNNNKIK